LLGHGVSERGAFQVFISLRPLLKLDDFQRVSGGSQRLCKERVWIERDRRHQRIQLIIRNRRSLFLGQCSLGCRLLCQRHRIDG
jgi:hypothetical protein